MKFDEVVELILEAKNSLKPQGYQKKKTKAYSDEGKDEYYRKAADRTRGPINHFNDVWGTSKRVRGIRSRVAWYKNKVEHDDFNGKHPTPELLMRATKRLKPKLKALEKKYGKKKAGAIMFSPKKGIWAKYVEKMINDNKDRVADRKSPKRIKGIKKYGEEGNKED